MLLSRCMHCRMAGGKSKPMLPVGGGTGYDTKHQQHSAWVGGNSCMCRKRS